MFPYHSWCSPRVYVSAVRGCRLRSHRARTKARRSRWRPTHVVFALSAVSTGEPGTDGTDQFEIGYRDAQQRQRWQRVDGGIMAAGSQPDLWHDCAWDWLAGGTAELRSFSGEHFLGLRSTAQQRARPSSCSHGRSCQLSRLDSRCIEELWQVSEILTAGANENKAAERLSDRAGQLRSRSPHIGR